MVLMHATKLELGAQKGVSLAEMALGYVISQSAHSFALVGTTSISHWKENVKAAQPGNPANALTAAEMAYMETGAWRRTAPSSPPVSTRRTWVASTSSATV